MAVTMLLAHGCHAHEIVLSSRTQDSFFERMSFVQMNSLAYKISTLSQSALAELEDGPGHSMYACIEIRTMLGYIRTRTRLPRT
jgi:hypothetical protein